MGTKREQIKMLVNENIKKSGADTTHLFATVGDGDMQKGIERFANYFTEDGIGIGKKIGEKSGFFKGAAVTGIIFTAILTGIELKKKNDEKKKHEKEEDEIIRCLKKDVKESGVEYSDEDE